MGKRRQTRPRRRFSPEFKAETVRVAREGEKSLTALARDLDLTVSAVARWVREAEIEEGRGPAGALKRAEREELVRLRRENTQLRMEREILKKATAFFAKEHA
jgi:transposase